MDLLLFTVLSSTSSDNEHQQDPFCLLPYSKGWRSEKCCSFPQEILIELDSDSSVNEITLQALQHFVPSKVEMYAAKSTSNDGDLVRARGASSGGRDGLVTPPTARNFQTRNRQEAEAAKNTLVALSPKGRQNLREGGAHIHNQSTLFNQSTHCSGAVVSLESKGQFGTKGSLEWELIGEIKYRSGVDTTLLSLRQYCIPFQGLIKLLLYKPECTRDGDTAEFLRANPYSRIVLSKLELWGNIFREVRADRTGPSRAIDYLTEDAVRKLDGSPMKKPDPHSVERQRDKNDEPLPSPMEARVFQDGSVYYKSKQSALEQTFLELGMPLDAVPFSARRPNPNNLDDYTMPLLEEVRGRMQKLQRSLYSNPTRKLQTVQGANQRVIGLTGQLLNQTRDEALVTTKQATNLQTSGKFPIKSPGKPNHALGSSLLDDDHQHRTHGEIQELQGKVEELLLLGQTIFQLEVDARALVAVDCHEKANKKCDHIETLKRKVLEIGAALDTEWWEDQITLERPPEDEFYRVDFETKIRGQAKILEKEKESKQRLGKLLETTEKKLRRLESEYLDLEDHDESKRLQIQRLEEEIRIIRKQDIIREQERQLLGPDAGEREYYHSSKYGKNGKGSPEGGKYSKSKSGYSSQSSPYSSPREGPRDGKPGSPMAKSKGVGKRSSTAKGGGPPGYDSMSISFSGNAYDFDPSELPPEEDGDVVRSRRIGFERLTKTMSPQKILEEGKMSLLDIMKTMCADEVLKSGLLELDNLLKTMTQDEILKCWLDPQDPLYCSGDQKYCTQELEELRKGRLSAWLNDPDFSDGDNLIPLGELANKRRKKVVNRAQERWSQLKSMLKSMDAKQIMEDGLMSLNDLMTTMPAKDLLNSGAMDLDNLLKTMTPEEILDTWNNPDDPLYQPGDEQYDIKKLASMRNSRLQSWVSAQDDLYEQGDEKNILPFLSMRRTKRLQESMDKKQLQLDSMLKTMTPAEILESNALDMDTLFKLMPIKQILESGLLEPTNIRKYMLENGITEDELRAKFLRPEDPLFDPTEDLEPEDALLDSLINRRLKRLREMVSKDNPLYEQGDEDLTIESLRMKRARKCYKSTAVQREKSMRQAREKSVRYGSGPYGKSGPDGSAGKSEPYGSAGRSSYRSADGTIVVDGRELSAAEVDRLLDDAQRDIQYTTLADKDGNEIHVLVNDEGEVVLDQEGNPLVISVDEFGKVRVTFNADGEVCFFGADGALVNREAAQDAITAGNAVPQAEVRSAVRDGRLSLEKLAGTTASLPPPGCRGINVDHDNCYHQEDLEVKGVSDSNRLSTLDRFFWDEQRFGHDGKYSDLVFGPGRDFPIDWNTVSSVTPRASKTLSDAQPILGDVFCAAFMHPTDWRLQDFALCTLTNNLDWIVRKILEESEDRVRQMGSGGMGATGYHSGMGASKSKGLKMANIKDMSRADITMQNPAINPDPLSGSVAHSVGGHTVGNSHASGWTKEGRRPISVSKIFRLLCELVLVMIDNTGVMHSQNNRKKVPIQLRGLQLLEKTLNSNWIDNIPVRVALACVKRVAQVTAADILGDQNSRVHAHAEACCVAIATQLGPTPLVLPLVSHPNDFSPEHKSPTTRKKVTPRLLHLPWKVLQGRLDFVLSLLSICGAPSFHVERTYSVHRLMPLIISGLNHQMWDVRHLAMEVATLLFQQCGLKLLPFFKEVPPNLIDALNARFSEVDPADYEDDVDFSKALKKAEEDVSQKQLMPPGKSRIHSYSPTRSPIPSAASPTMASPTATKRSSFGMTNGKAPQYRVKGPVPGQQDALTTSVASMQTPTRQLDASGYYSQSGHYSEPYGHNMHYAATPDHLMGSAQTMGTMGSTTVQNRYLQQQKGRLLQPPGGTPGAGGSPGPGGPPLNQLHSIVVSKTNAMHVSNSEHSAQQNSVQPSSLQQNRYAPTTVITSPVPLMGSQDTLGATYQTANDSVGGSVIEKLSATRPPSKSYGDYQAEYEEKVARALGNSRKS